MPPKKRKPSRNTIQLWDGEWHNAGEPYYHICCNEQCQLAHYVEFRIDPDSGKLQSKWTTDQKMTDKARAKASPG